MKTIEGITIEGIFESFNKWREERGLKDKLGNVAANISEEITEYLRATNDIGRVDALCDICFHAIHALHVIDKIPQRHIILQLCDDNRRWLGNPFAMLVLSFSEYVAGTYIDKTYSLICIAHYAKLQIRLHGFDFLIAMDETLKELNSRTGAWNKETGKWEKFKTEEAMALWYKADYSKAKVA